MNPAEKLRAAASQFRERDLDRLNEPAWGGWGWEQYVSEDVRNLWGELSEESRLVAFIKAQELRRFAPDLE